MGRTPEITTQGELLVLRDMAIALGRLPEAEISTGSVSHATSYLVGTERIGIEFLEDWERNENPFFYIEHIVLKESEEAVALRTERDYTLAHNAAILRPRYKLTFEETLRTFAGGKELGGQPVDIESYGTRKSRRLMKQREKEVRGLYDQFGEFGLTRHKYDSMFLALGKCSVDNLLAVGEEAAYGEK